MGGVALIIMLLFFFSFMLVRVVSVAYPPPSQARLDFEVHFSSFFLRLFSLDYEEEDYSISFVCFWKLSLELCWLSFFLSFFLGFELDFATTKYWQFVGFLFICVCVCVFLCFAQG
jgi:hypothetical protein